MFKRASVNVTLAVIRLLSDADVVNGVGVITADELCPLPLSGATGSAEDDPAPPLFGALPPAGKPEASRTGSESVLKTTTSPGLLSSATAGTFGMMATVTDEVLGPLTQVGIATYGDTVTCDFQRLVLRRTSG